MARVRVTGVHMGAKILQPLLLDSGYCMLVKKGSGAHPRGPGGERKWEKVVGDVEQRCPLPRCRSPLQVRQKRWRRLDIPFTGRRAGALTRTPVESSTGHEFA